MSSKARVSIPVNVRQMIHNIKEITGNHSEEEVHAMLKECSMDPNETAQKLQARVSIPVNVRQMIHNIKEITGNHSEEEVHAMLKECSMDPNETAQKLLLQDTFHEVKRKPRRKEILNKEPAESRWIPGMQGRGNRGGRENYSSRPTSHDAGGKNNSASGKENVTNHSERGGTMPATSQDKKHAEATFVLSSSTAVADGQPDVHSESIIEPTVQRADVAVVVVRPIEDKKPSISSHSGVYFSVSDPVLLPSQESRVQNAVGTIRREVGIHQTQPHRKSTMVSKANKSQGGGKNQLSESYQPAVSTHTSPPVNYTSRSQQVIGSQKVARSKEWKPKTNPNLAQTSSGTVTSSQVLTTPAVEAHNNDKSRSQPDELNATVVSKENTSEVERKLEKSLHISESQSQQQHVVIPNHLHVRGAEKLGFCFGSFDASFGLNTISNTSVREGDPTKQPLSESSEDESVEEQHLSSNQNTLGTVEDQDCAPSSSSHLHENLSTTEGHDDVSANVVVPGEYNNNSDESKQEEANHMVPPGVGHQYSVVHTSPNYNFGFMPPMLGNQIAAPFESTPESQARGDVSRLPSFLVPQPFDHANYYAQFYRSGADSDGRISPFHPPGVSTKFNGNVAVLSTHTTQVSQEGGNQLILSTAAPTAHVNQNMQSSIAVSQQPLPVFRQPPGGVHLPPHYAPNYIPYGHYISPFYVPPIHQFLSNGAFPQQAAAAAAGTVYQAGPPAVTAKYSLSQYKPGSNTAAIYGGAYGSTPASGGYSANSASNSGNSTSPNEELGGGSQFKESSNVYITGQQQQNEGPGGVWITGPTARDISSLQAASSFYNLPQAGGQFAPGIYHHHHHPATPTPPPPHHTLVQQQSQPMVDITTSVYQQPPSAQQINWPNNY